MKNKLVMFRTEFKEDRIYVGYKVQNVYIAEFYYDNKGVKHSLIPIRGIHPAILQRSAFSKDEMYNIQPFTKKNLFLELM